MMPKTTRVVRHDGGSDGEVGMYSCCEAGCGWVVYGVERNVPHEHSQSAHNCDCRIVREMSRTRSGPKVMMVLLLLMLIMMMVIVMMLMMALHEDDDHYHDDGNDDGNIALLSLLMMIMLMMITYDDGHDDHTATRP